MLYSLSIALLSCSALFEQPKPFPNLVLYQGVNRFSFGSEPEPFITSVPGDGGERVKIASIEDDFYSSEGFLLYICSLVSSPNTFRLYRYDYDLGDSVFLSTVSSKFEPRFFALQNDYSPGFVMDTEEDGYAYAFLRSGTDIISFDEEICPRWANQWGYVTSLRNPKNASEYALDPNKVEGNAFNFYDGTVVSLNDGARVVSAGENHVLFLSPSNLETSLVQYRKGTGVMTVYEGDYDRGRVYADRPTASTNFYTECSFLWRWDYDKKEIVIVSTHDGKFTEKTFSYDPFVFSSFDRCEWIVSSEIVLVSSGGAEHDRELYIDLKEGALKEIEGKGSGRRTVFSTFDRVIFQNEKYELIERYEPTHGGELYRNRAAYYVLDRKTNEMLLVQANSRPPLRCQMITAV